MVKSRNSILLLSLSGIGNYIMHTPFIAELRRQRPDSHIAVWCAPRGQAVFARANPDIDEVIEAPQQSPFIKDITFIWRLRRGGQFSPPHPPAGGEGVRQQADRGDGYIRPFDAAVMLSPGQLIKGAAYMFAAGIPQRIAHQYPFRDNPNSHFLLTSSIPETANIHDIEQNFALLPLLGITSPLIRGSRGVSPFPPLMRGGDQGGVVTYSLHIPPENQQKADKLAAVLNIPQDKILVGLHPGSAPNAGYKRWPSDRFATVARALIEKHNAQILIFGGPDEEELKKNLAKQSFSPSSEGEIKRGWPVTLITSDLLTTAAITQKCNLFISNDSGLMHIAAASGAPTLGLFGPTSEVETGPRGSQSFILRAPGTKPVYNTEANAGLGDEPHPSLRKISLEEVIAKAQEILTK